MAQDDESKPADQGKESRVSLGGDSEFGRTESGSLDTSGQDDDTPRLEPGERLDRYLIIDKLGQGAMGTVYRAYDPELDRRVAIKLLRTQNAPEAHRQRFKREAQALAKLAHPHVVAIHDVAEYQGDLYLAMEYVEGETLDEWMRGAKCGWQEVVGVFIQAGEGLACAHQAGIVHRDFKPGNVILGSDGRVRVLDFGLARALSEDESALSVSSEESQESCDTGDSQDRLSSSDDLSASTDRLLYSPLTVMGARVGTPAYMAPEQHVGGPVDARADQFAFSVALYEALYGRRPFRARNLHAWLKKINRGRMRRPPSDARVPQFLFRILRRGLAANPEQRFDDMQAMLKALSFDPRQRFRRLAVAVVVILALGLGLLGLSYGLTATTRRCDQAGSQIESVWNQQQADAVRAAFEKTGQPYAGKVFGRVRTLLDRWAANWSQTVEEACLATHQLGSQSAELLDLRMACLSRKKAKLASLLDVFVHKTDKDLLHKAVEACLSLGGFESCSDERALRSRQPLPESPETLKRIKETESLLDQAEALLVAGKYKDGLVVSQQATEKAREAGFGPLLGRTQLVHAKLLDQAGQLKHGVEVAQQALESARRNADPDLAARALGLQVWVQGYKLSQYEQGLQIGKFAQLLLDVNAAPDELRAGLSNSIGSILYAKGRGKQALEEWQRALEMREKIYGPDHPKVAATTNNMGLVYLDQNALEKARAAFERAGSIWKAALGEDHPEVSFAQLNLAKVYSAQNQIQKAIDTALESLRLRQKSLGPDHPDMAFVLELLGLQYRKKNDYPKAIHYYLKTLEVYKKHFGKDHWYCGITHSELAYVYMGMGDFAEAKAHAKESHRLYESHFGPNHAYMSTVERLLGMIALEEGQVATARQHLERTLEICANTPCEGQEHNRLQSNRFTLAKLLWADKKSRSRAVKLVRLAEEAMSKFPARHKGSIEAIQAWLAERQ